MIRIDRFRSRQWIVVALAGVGVTIQLSLPAQSNAAYVVPDHVENDSTLSRWLFNQIADGVESGVESVGKKILTSVGRDLLGSIAPSIADFLFGGGNGLDAAVQRIVEEIHTAQGDLAQRHRALLDEVQDQYQVDLIAKLTFAGNSMDSWLSSDDLLLRQASAEVLLNVMTALTEVRNTVQQYVAAGANPTITYRRMQLLPLHITAAQLSVLANRYYYATRALETAFERAHGANVDLFDQWFAALTEADIADIEETAVQAVTFQQDVYSDVLGFYEQIAALDPVDSYVDDLFTPIVSQGAKFTRNVNQYDVPSVTNDPDSWGDNAAVFLDGLRAYYYAGIPNADCLRGYSYHELRDWTPGGDPPWVEVENQPAASDCNRYWLLDPYVDPFPDFGPPVTAAPLTYYGSFVGYEMQWLVPEVMYEVHRNLVHGDLVRAVYGPVSLILDAMYAALEGGARPSNAWDRLFVEYDRTIAILGLGTSYEEAPIYELVLVSAAALDSMGLDIDTVGVSDWNALLAAYYASPGDFDPAAVTDFDGDGVANFEDNCPSTPNRLQSDSNRDGVGDSCPCVVTNTDPSCDPPVAGPGVEIVSPTVGPRDPDVRRSGAVYTGTAAATDDALVALRIEILHFEERGGGIQLASPTIVKREGVEFPVPMKRVVWRYELPGEVDAYVDGLMQVRVTMVAASGTESTSTLGIFDTGLVIKCYVLSEVFGDPRARAIQVLWDLHERLVPNWDAAWHRSYMRWYDDYGPRIAATIRDYPVLKGALRLGFGATAWLAEALGLASLD